MNQFSVVFRDPNGRIASVGAVMTRQECEESIAHHLRLFPDTNRDAFQIVSADLGRSLKNSLQTGGMF